MYKTLPLITIFLFHLAFVSFSSNTTPQKQKSTIKKVSDDEAIRKKADALAHRFVIVDGHVDLPYRLHAKMEDVSVQTSGGDFDYVRAKKEV
jgi:membrane dipeptidase